MTHDGSGTPPERVRVTGPPRRRTPVARSSDLDTGTRLGGVFLGSLLREQLRLAAVVVVVLVLLVGSLPLLFHVAPGLASRQLLGLPVPWLLLAVGVYPVLLGLGWAFVRRAERNERDFADLLADHDEGDA